MRSLDLRCLLDSRSLITLRQRLLKWFARHQRDLPWRHNRDPYRIWISEVMLQQTTVATVIPRFHQFLQNFPTIHDLARADEQEVLRAWAGLGYYRRARDLHRSARWFVEHFETPLPNPSPKRRGAKIAEISSPPRFGEGPGEGFLDCLLPDDPAVWEQLPGVGRYIHAAVLSQAFDRRLPIVEANSQRVLCRLFGKAGDPKSGPVKKWLWETAAAILPHKKCGDFNQAIMELGALICTPVSPQCGKCPLAKCCIAQRDSLQDALPTKSAPIALEEVREVAIVVRRGSKVLLVRRPETGRWANMWEFPHAPLEKDESHDQAAKRQIAGLGITAKFGAELMSVRHAVTRFRITMVCFEAIYRSGAFASAYYQEGRWLEPGELIGYPVSSPQRKLAEEIARSHRRQSLF